MLAAALLLTHTTQIRIAHEFVFVAPATAQRVTVAGSFNSWNKDANPMVCDADGKTWRVKLDLPVGRVAYKFVVNGSEWITDKTATQFEDDGNSGKNSVTFIFPSEYSQPAVRGDGIVTMSAVSHNQKAPFVNFDRGHLTLQLKTRAGDVDSVSVKAGSKVYPANLVASDEFQDTYSANVAWDKKTPLSYTFLVNDGSKSIPVGPYTLDSTYKPIQVAPWVESRVFYQIFPDRFANGDPSNDPKGTVAWNSKPEYYNFFGGDFAGVDQHASYLKRLGVGAVYFNPIFKGPSNHGYETTDYRQVDPRFGTNAEFKGLVADLHRDDIKVVLDGVFNHTATNFFAFQDIINQGEKSPYKNWYFVKSYPVTVRANPPYEAWWGFASLPKLNVANPEVSKYILDSADYWLKDVNIDGWRLDVPNEVDAAFWPKFRDRVKSHGQDKWICGEIWTDASQWLQGDMFDSVMNYPFQKAVVSYIAHKEGKASEFESKLFSNYGAYAPQTSRNLFNHLTSHDTPRFLTECGGNHKLADLGAVVQFTWPGSPSVYYGEELGMEGGKDPDNRRAMRWDLNSPTNPTLNHYKKLIRLRKSSRALSIGDPVRIFSDDLHNIFSFGRVFDKDKAVIVINRSESSQMVDMSIPKELQLAPTRYFVDALSGKHIRASKENGLHLTLDPLSSAVLLPDAGRVPHTLN